MPPAMKSTLLKEGFLVLAKGTREIKEGADKGLRVEIKGPIMLAVDTELNKLAIGYLDKFEPKKILKGTKLSEEQHAALKRGEAILLSVKGKENIVRFNPTLKNISFWDHKAMEEFKAKLSKVPVETEAEKIERINRINKIRAEKEAQNQNQKNPKPDMPVEKVPGDTLQQNEKNQKKGKSI